MEIADFFRDFYRPFNPMLSARTVTLYRFSIGKFGLFLGRAPTVGDFDNRTIGRYLQALIDAGLQISSVNKERRQLLALWRAARDEGLVTKGPRIKPLPEPERIPLALSIDQLIAVRKATCTMPGMICGVPARHWWRSVVSMTFCTGERIGAVLALRWADIDGRTVIIRAETRKGGRRSLIKRLPDYAMLDLDCIRRPARELLYPWDHADTDIWRIGKRIFATAGVPIPTGKVFHLLRSSHATHLEAAGGDATGSLGHASRATTRKHYLDPRFLDDGDGERLPKIG